MPTRSLEAGPAPNWPKWVGLGILISLGLWYLTGEVAYAISRDRAGEPPVRTVVLLLHVAATTPILMVAPLQLSRRIRLRWPKWHRRAGTAYLIAAMVSSAGAVYLGVTFDGAERWHSLLPRG
jgi:hypothetical protein